ncbi:MULTISPECIES: hypothetical protein [Sphingobium]|uniref:Uncharacterized protein n=1 Tax=Sphingobium chungbukense TaxID=56193 RepID=A0A0M3ANK7_9SPHN|nr:MULTISPECIES: hypothetical protein [Sphingobium]AMK26123.1 hypothetical protein K426_26120 [Sphingobium sp. TKS]KKW90521.1 hypothetical protein YP76_18130 [Sphingobium chungbukense]
MNMLSRLDVWLGTTLFHPPIILVCQLTRQSQYALYRALWFFAACHATYYGLTAEKGLVFSVFMWGWVVATLVNATLYPDRPARSSGFFRGIFWIFFLSGAAFVPLTGTVTDGTVRALIVLFAEYAATIKTIPPRRKTLGSFSGKRKSSPSVP